MPNVTALPHVLQPDFVSVLVEGKPRQYSKGQPAFKLLHSAISKGQWGRVPKLLTLASQLSEKSHGKVSVTANGVFYRGQKIQNALTTKINELIEHGKPVAHALRFMDNLYQQPDMNTVNEVYEWLSSGRFALTSDGCFLAYKAVNKRYKDKRTDTIDNSVGSVPMMPREDVDPSKYNECSYGLHFCSKSYLPHFYSISAGDHIMEIKINPADVVAIPRGYGFSKGRTWRYEVLREVQEDEMVVGVTDSPVMMQPVIEIADSRPELIKQVKALPTVQRLVRRGKLTPLSFKKASVERLTSWLRKFSRMDIAPAKSKLFDNPLRFAREAAGKTMGEVAKMSGLTLQAVYNAERCQHPEQSVIDLILKAIAKLQGNDDIRRSGVSYPRPTERNMYQSTFASSTPVPVATTVSAVVTDDDDDYDDDDDDENS